MNAAYFRVRKILFCTCCLFLTVSFSHAQTVLTDLQIAYYSPEGENSVQAQIQIIFNKPLIPSGTSDANRAHEILSHFKVTPVSEGVFRFLGANTVIYESKYALAPATEYHVRITKGIKALDGSALKSSFSWSFRTPGPRILYVTPQNLDHAVLDQEITVVSSQPLDTASLNEHVRFVEDRPSVQEESIPFEITTSPENAKRNRLLKTNQHEFRYSIKPVSQLKTDTRYSVTIKAGVRGIQGNLRTPADVTASFKTFSPFRFLKMERKYDAPSNLNASYELIFTNGVTLQEMNQRTVLKEGKATFTNKLIGLFERVTKNQNKKQIQASSDHALFSVHENAVKINNTYLHADKDYEISLEKDLTDIYGQKLENSQQVRFHSGSLQPAIFVPESLYRISRKDDPLIQIEVQAIEKLLGKISTVNPIDLLGVHLPKDLRALAQRIKGEYETFPGAREKNKQERHEINLKPKLNQDGFGAVLYDFYAPEEGKRQSYPDGEHVHHTGLLFRTDLDVHVKISPQDGIVFVTSLTTGEPQLGAKVSIHRTDTKQPCASGITDSRGVFLLNSKEMLVCLRQGKNKRSKQTREEGQGNTDFELRYAKDIRSTLSLIVTKGSDWTFLQINPDNANAAHLDSSISSAWEDTEAVPAGMIFSDHAVYRPGDTVELKGIARYRSFGTLNKEVNAQFDVALHNPDGTRMKLNPVLSNEFGTFSIKVPIRKYFVSGPYTIIATSRKTRLKYQGSFEVAHLYSHVNVHMVANKSIILPGEKLHILIDADSHVAAPRADSEATIKITGKQVSVHPKGWNDFHFGIPESIHRELYGKEPSIQDQTNEIILNSQGKSSYTPSLSMQGIHTPIEYSFDLVVRDSQGQSATASAKTTVFPHPLLAGMKIREKFGKARKRIEVLLIVVDPDGKPQPGVPLVLTLKRRHIEMHSGQESSSMKIEETDADSCEVMSSEKPVTCVLMPPSAGSYVIQAGFKENPQPGTEVRRTFYALGRETGALHAKQDHHIEILFDKETYAPGETARALIQSPYPAAEMLFTIEREKFLFKKRGIVEGGISVVEFKVTREMIPNCYAGVILVPKGLASSETQNDHSIKTGYAPFRVSLDEKKVRVLVVQKNKQVKPGESIRVDFETLDQGGKPVSAELAVMVFDEAVHALREQDFPDVLASVYANRGLSMRTFDNRYVKGDQIVSDVVPFPGEKNKVSASRQRVFRDSAYYHPSLVTGQDGKASVQFTLPNNPAQWRMVAVAITRDDKFGYGSSGIAVPLPLLGQPMIPEFVRSGDIFQLGVPIQLAEGIQGEVIVSTALSENGPILFSDFKNEFRSAVSLAGGEQKTVMIPCVARTKGTAVLTITAQVKGKNKDDDSVTFQQFMPVSFPVYDTVFSKTTIISGEIEKEHHEKITIPESRVKPDAGGLEISLASTAFSQLDESVRYQLQDSDHGLEQITSLLLVLMQSQDFWKRSKINVPGEKSIIQEKLEALRSLQNEDGGFIYWPSDRRSDPWISALVAPLLIRAEELKYQIPKEVKNSLGAYLKNKLKHIPSALRKCSWNCNAYYRIHLLTGMYSLGLADKSYYQEYLAKRKELPLDARIQLALLLSQIQGWKTQSELLFDEIKKELDLKSITQSIEDQTPLPGLWQWLSSPIVTASNALHLFLVREPDHPAVPVLTRFLLDARSQGRWKNSYENAIACNVLFKLFAQKEQPESDFTATIKLAAKKIFETDFKGDETSRSEINVPVKDISPGMSDLFFRKENLYYTVQYAYILQDIQPARQKGFYVERKISRFNPSQAQAQDQVYTDRISLGQIVAIELTIAVPQTGFRFAVVDPLPAGLKAVDTVLGAISQQGINADTSDQDKNKNSFSPFPYPFNHVELGKDGIKLFANEIKPGVYHYTYLAQAVMPGTFEHPGTTAVFMYNPEQHGRGAEGIFHVEP
ncbi:MAG: Ig-like domain-containing protein [Nitrospirota bacterium]